jgi:hypothetical protein
MAGEEHELAELEAVGLPAVRQVSRYTRNLFKQVRTIPAGDIRINKLK